MPMNGTIVMFLGMMYQKTKAALKLMYELQKGRISGEQNGWHSEDDVEKLFKRLKNL